MRRTKTFRLAIILGLLLASVYLIKLYIKHKVEEMTFELYLEDTEKIELARTEEVRRIEFKSEGDVLFANWSFYDEESPSIFILHGNGETLSNWVETQTLLREQGYNSFVFDYSGFGSSTGVPLVETLNGNAKDAWDKLYELITKSENRIAFGYSLGSAVLLGSVNEYSSVPNTIIVHAPFSSAREIAIELGTADRFGLGCYLISGTT